MKTLSEDFISKFYDVEHGWDGVNGPDVKEWLESRPENNLNSRKHKLVEQYAGRIFVGVRASGNRIGIKEIVECSHGLAKAVMESLSNEAKE